MLMPRALDEAFSTSPDNNDGDDAAFTLTAVVTREGRIENLELLNTSSGFGAALGSDESKTVESLMDAVSRARFQPARVFEHVSDVDGLPVAVNMVWLVAHTTVRASKITAELTIPRRRTAQVRPIRLPLSCRAYRGRGASTWIVATLFIVSVARMLSPRSPSAPSMLNS